MMYFHILILFLAASFGSLTAFDFCGEGVLQLGWFTATQGKSQHVNIEGLIGDHFSVSKSSGQSVLVGAGYYLDGMDMGEAEVQYGINAFYLSPTRVSGEVTQEDLFTNLSYHYSRTNYPIYAAAKAMISCGIVFDAGIGPNFVNTSGFKERSLDGGITVPDKIFSGKTTVAFSATFGLGWRIYQSFEVNYRFFYLGQGELKKVNNQVKNTLRTGHSYANALFVSYIF